VPLSESDGKAAAGAGKSEDLPEVLSVCFVDGRALAQILRIKKGHPRIESFIGPGIFVSPGRPFLTYFKEVFS